MRISRISLWPLALALTCVVTIGHAQTSPYAGQQSREVKSLSAQDIDDLLNGRGMALAKAGELNGYPGPLHVLELASELRLTDEQLRLITEIKNRMTASAKPWELESY